MNNFTHQYPAKQDFGGIIPNRPYARVRENARLVREHKIGFIPPLGGGSVIDCCKTVSVQAIPDEDIRNTWVRPSPVTEYEAVHSAWYKVVKVLCSPARECIRNG